MKTRLAMLIAAVVVAMLLAVMGCGGGTDGGGTELQPSELEDIWRVYFTVSGEEEGAEELLFLENNGSAFVSKTIVNGVPKAYPVTLKADRIAFTYRTAVRDCNVTGTVGTDEMSGTWIGNASAQNGTWHAIKGLALEPLESAVYETGNVVMAWLREDDTALATLYGTPPEADGEPRFSAFVFDTDATETGMLSITLDTEERMTRSLLGAVKIILAYDDDHGVFGYELYADDVLVFSGSDIADASSAKAQKPHRSAVPAAILIESASPNAWTPEPGNTFADNVMQYKQYAVLEIMKEHFNRTRTEDRGRYVAFWKNIEKETVLIRSIEQYAVFNLLHVYNKKSMEQTCRYLQPDLRDICESSIEKADRLWSGYAAKLRSIINDAVDRAFVDYNIQCIDIDGDGYFVAYEDGLKVDSNRTMTLCGTEEDCENIFRFDVHPGAQEICTDGWDNDCDGRLNCADSDCVSNPNCFNTDVNCSAEREKNIAREKELEKYAEMNCEQNGYYSGCLLDWFGTFFPYWASNVFSDELCSSSAGYADCASKAFGTYVSCLDACNTAWVYRTTDYTQSKACADQCYAAMDDTMEHQCIKH